MAQAYTSEPAIQSPSDNPLIFEYYESGFSGGANTTDFYFAIEVYVEGVLVGNYRTSIEDVSGIKGYSHFDASSIIRNYVTHNQRLDAGIAEANIISYYITFTPYYTVSGVDYTGTTTTSSTRYAWKGKLEKKDWISFTSDTLFPNVKDNDTASLLEWCTQFPSASNYYVGLDEQCFLSTYAYGTTFQEAFFELFDSSGVSITTATYTFASTIDNGINLNCSPQSIIDETTITTANFSTCAYYTVIAKDNTGTPVTVTETFTFHIDLDCSRYEKVRAFFLSKSGNVDAFTFRLLSRETVKTKASGYERSWGEWVTGTTEQEFQYSLEQGGSSNYLIQSTKKLLINSDWISEAVQNWLVENMYESPYLVITQDDVTQSAMMESRTFEFKKIVNDKLINERVNLMISHDDKSMVI